MVATIFPSSSYGITVYISGQKPALSYDRLQLFSSYTQGGTVPFYVRWQYSAKYVIDKNSTPSNPSYPGWGPLDETLDKIAGTPGLRMILNLAYFPQNWLKIDGNGNLLTYGDANAVLPDGPAMKIFAQAVANRYTSLINSGILIPQIGNEEYDTGLGGKLGTVGGTVLAHTFNYAAPAIKAIASQALVIAGSVRPLSHPNGGQGTLLWMQNFWNYLKNFPGGKYYANEPGQAIPDRHDFHLYRDSVVITSNKTNVAPDPMTTDNSDVATSAVVPNVAQVVQIMQSVIQASGQSVPIGNLENGFNVPNNDPDNHNNSPTDTPDQQDRYTQTVMAQLWYAGATMYNYYSSNTSNNDPRALTGASTADFNSFIVANPQWTAGGAPSDKIYTSADKLAFWGTTSTTPPDQYFSIMNYTGSQKAWSISSSQPSWLTASTLPSGGIGTTKNANLTSGNLAAGQFITLKCSANSTANGLTLLTQLTGTLTITVGAVTKTITVTLFPAKTTTNPNLTSATKSLSFSMNAGASAPANQTFSFKNADTDAAAWYAFTSANWLSINTSSGTLAGGSSQNITVSMNSAVVPNLAPGTYSEVVTMSATPHPTPYDASNPPAATPFISVTINLTVHATAAANVQVSASALQYTAVASGSLPATQTFYFVNCSNGSQPFTVAKTQSWLTLSKTSGNLPAYGTSTGAKPDIQHTDYQVITVTANTTAKAAGTYTDTITVTMGTGGGTSTQTIPVTYIVTSTGATMTLGASPTSRSFSQVVGGSSVSNTITLTNSGNTNGNYSSGITYNQAQTGWLNVSLASGAISGSGGTATITLTCTPGTLVAGTYTASVLFTPSIGTSTATVTVSFTVSAGASPTLAVFPPTLTFNDTVGANSAVPQTVTLSNTGAGDGAWASSIAYNGLASGWIALSPDHDTLLARASEFVTLTMIDAALKVGTYTASITFSAGASQVVVSVTLIVSPAPLSFVTSGSAQMTQGDLTAQYQRIMANVVGPQLKLLATTYYTNPLTSQVEYGELDALFPYESLAANQLHVMKTIDDVTAFLTAYSYVANVLSDNPIVYYRFGESSGVQAYDISGRNMTATLSNTGGVVTGVTQSQPSAIPASADTSYLFDGTSGSVTLPPAVNTANWPALSVEAFINFTNITFSQTAFVIANDATLLTNLGFEMEVLKNALIFRIGTGSTYYEINQTYAWAANTWYHLVGVFSGTSLTVYVNGNPIATTSGASTLVAQTTNSVQIAAKPGTTANNFPGLIDEPSMFKSALSAIRVQAHYLARLAGTGYAALILSDGPLAFWRLQETSGTVAADSSGNGRSATLSGSSLTYSQTGIVTGGAAIGFGAYDSLVFPSSLVLANYAAYSLEYWINLTSGWQYIAITVDSSGNTLYYLNGSPYTSGSGDSVVVDIDLYYTGAFAAGSLTEVAPYGYVLSAAQISNHYQIGSLGT